MLLLAVTGCIRVEQTIILNEDGSGTVKLAYAVTEQNAAMLEAAMQNSEGAGAMPQSGSIMGFTEETVRMQFKELEPYGVTLKEVNSETRDGWQHLEMAAAFESLKGLAQTPLLSDRAVSLTKTRNGNYKFRQKAGDEQPSMAAGAADNPQMQQAIQEMMKGFRVQIRIQTPGEIIKSSAPEAAEREAIWTFDLEKDADAVQQVEKLDMWVIFEGKGLDLPELGGHPTEE
jgi:hypothetical protein